MHHTVFEFIDAADEHGMYRFVAERKFMLQLLGSKQDIQRELVQSRFDSQSWSTLKLEQVKKWITDVGIQSTRAESGDWHLELNLAKLFLLPGEAPRSELLQLREFFASMKPFLEEEPGSRRRVQLVNNRRGGRIEGGLSCLVTREDGAEPEHAVEHETSLHAMVKASPVLQYFIKHLAMVLQRMGPWSWYSLTEEHLYPVHEGPFATYRWEQRQKKVAAAAEGAPL